MESTSKLSGQGTKAANSGSLVVYDFFEKIKETDLFSWMKIFQSEDRKRRTVPELQQATEDLIDTNSQQGFRQNSVEKQDFLAQQEGNERSIY